MRRVGVAPGHVDLVYTHRPIEELPGIIAMAQACHAKAIWLQSGLTSTGTKDDTGYWLPQEESRMARELVEAVGMAYLDKPYIGDAVRRMGGSG